MGILLAKDDLIDYSVKAILLPPQSVSRDSCKGLECGNQIRINLTEQKALIEVGWIHTHPVQDQMMSSPDMHTTWNYQTQNKSSISIVWSKKDPHIQYYRLKPIGMEEIGKCKTPGENFCNHSKSWYTVATHVYFTNDDKDFKIYDMRKELTLDPG